MKNTKHTPGPWEVDELNNTTVWGKKQRFNMLVAKCGDAQIILQEEAEANARLIAAAPELLEACKKVKSDLFQYEGGRLSQQDLLNNIESLGKAIAKAEGK